MKRMKKSEVIEEPLITRIKATKLDQLIQVLEISFIFLVCYSLITLIDSALLDNVINLYSPIANDFLGEATYGNLNGGNFEEIVRITLIFNLLLFSFSLFFGVWIRRTRDGWSWSQLGYTTRTYNYDFKSIIIRAVLLGLIAIVIWFTILTPLVFIVSGGNSTEAFLVHAFHKDGELFTARQLYAEFYFGVVEMGFIWPLSAGFFFFAYVHNSFKARFPKGVANLVSSIFYVIYLGFFFIVQTPDKLLSIQHAMITPMFWVMVITFLIVLYISFSAFTETGSIVLPFLLNFVFNVGLTLIKAYNSLFFATAPSSSYFFMLIPYIGILIIIGLWLIFKSTDFSTIRLGIQHIKILFKKETRLEVSFLFIAGIVILFFILSFGVPGILEHVIYTFTVTEGLGPYSIGDVAFVFAIIYMVMIGLAIIVLTYEPTKVFDVLLVKMPDGIPISTHQQLFQSDEVLISGFFTAISSVSKELDDDEKADLRSIKRGDREILIIDGVLTRIIALADRDQARIRQMVQILLRKFEAEHSNVLVKWIGDPHAIPKAKELVESISNLSIRFDIPQQTRWMGFDTNSYTIND
jgi:hypothetical protein